ncbi:MAG TPA: hypothetical protein VK586_19140 [Streptosporangiaceae bacterium]|nr:hypothetical protein [Streptosporangiaceae bacterium]
MTRLRITTPDRAAGSAPGRAAGSAPGRAAGGVRPRRGRPARRYAGLAGACCLALLGAGCGTSMGSASPSSSSPGTATSSSAGQPSSASPPAGSVTALSPATQKALAAKYLAIAQPANRSLDTENDGYGDAEHDDLAAARKDLLDEAATEARFDSQLLAIKFPASIKQQVQALVSANKIRIQLTQRQARATTLASLRAFDSQHKAADAAVEAPVRQIRHLLALPPPSTS